MFVVRIILVVSVGFVVLATLAPLSRRKAWWVRGWEFPRLQLAALALVLGALVAWQSPYLGVPALPLLAALVACFAWQAAWIFPFSPLARREVRNAPVAARVSGPMVAGARAVSTPAEPTGGAPVRDARDADRRLRLLSANVMMSNREADRLLAVIDDADPDVVIALETDRWWESRLDVLGARYPHACRCAKDNRYGMHVYSRLAFEGAEIRYLIEPGVPSMRITLRLAGGERVRLNVVHPTPPSPTERETSRQRDAELVMVGLEVTGLDMPVVVAGDLNDVAWSRTTRQFRRISGLLDPRRGRGMFNTFHADRSWMRWPLDHVFHSPHFALAGMRRLRHVGSDHFPILVDLRLVS